MSWKSRKTDDFEFCIDLRTVICDLQHFVVECCALVDPQPFSVHVGENAAERVVDQPFERQLFQFRQRLIAIPKDPIHRRVFLAEHHFNVCKGKRHMVKAGVETVVPLPRGGSVIVLQCLTDIQRFTIDQVDRFGHIVDRFSGHQTAPIHPKKRTVQCISKCINGGVLWAATNGITAGTDGTHFTPDGNCTRAQLWTMLARQAGVDLTGGAIWYAKAQDWAMSNGISDGTNPDKNISRAEMVTMLYRVAGTPTVNSKTQFEDVDSDAYYANAVAWAVEKNITTGVSNDKFAPNGTCTREQMVTFLYRYNNAK